MSLLWESFDRGAIRGAIEEASGISLSHEDALPDTLIAHAEQLGLTPIQLRIWIYDQPKRAWVAAELERWAQRNGFARCGHCGEPVADPAAHECKPAAEASQ